MESFETWSLSAPVPRAILEAFGFLLAAWYRWVFALLMAAAGAGPGLYQSWRLRRAGMPAVDRMSGAEFEDYLESLFQRLGYQVERVEDQVVLVKGGERILVQPRRHSRNIGSGAVQAAAAARAQWMCQRAVVVSNREFSGAARAAAESHHVELWGRRKLAELILAKK